MKPCPGGCGSNIGDGVELCSQCAYKKKNPTPNTSNKNTPQDISDILKHINWNLGASQKWMKLDLLNKLECQTTTLTEIQEKIHNSLLNDLDKDIKVIKDIKKDSEK